MRSACASGGSSRRGRKRSSWGTTPRRPPSPAAAAARQNGARLGADASSAAIPSRQGLFELELADGRQLRHHTRAVRGTPDNPMTRAEVDAKSYDLLEPVIGRGRA